jgi:hypothetical protein
MIIKFLYILITINIDINLKFLRFKISFEIKCNFEFGSKERDMQFQLVTNNGCLLVICYKTS